MGKRTLGSCLCTFSGNVRVIGFDDPGVGGVCRYNIVSTMRCGVSDRRIRTGRNGLICNFWGWVYLYCKIKGRSRARSANWRERIDDGLLRIGGIP